MAMSIHTNYAHLVTINVLNKTYNSYSTSLERLSTGYRINSAADDAAGLQIANRLELQSRSMAVATRNSQDAISMMQTAESAMDEMTEIAYRMNDLATQAANGSNTDQDRTALNAEFQALATQLSEMTANTNFGGQKLLAVNSGVFAKTGGVVFQTGATASNRITVDVSENLSKLHAKLSEFTSMDLVAADGAHTAMETLTGFINVVGASRASFGAQINNFEHNINNLANMTENLEVSKGRIMDTDFAKESGLMMKNQMLMQAVAQMLNSTKTMPQYVMSMLN